MTAWARALPSAQAALERVEAKHADCVACIAYDAVCTGNSVQAFRLSDLRTRIARLEAALIAASYVVEKFASIGIRDEGHEPTPSLLSRARPRPHMCSWQISNKVCAIGPDKAPAQLPGACGW